MDLKLLVFDFDGTLADTIPLCVAGLQHALEKNTGGKYSREQIVAEFGITEEGILQKLAPECAESCVRDFLHYYRENHTYHLLFEGIPELLTEAADLGLRLALVTGKGSGSARISHEALHLSQFFSTVRTGSAERDVKADHIRNLCLEFDLPVASAAYVGDSPSDMVASREAGAFSIAALWSNTVTQDRILAENPDAAFTTVEEFRQWLRQLRKGPKEEWCWKGDSNS